MKKLATLIAFALALAGRSHAQTYNLFQPANGILKGSTTTYKTSAAVASDIFGLFSGSCSSSTYLRGDGACASPPGIGTVTSVSVVSANGFAGTIANPTSTPAITLSTSITGPLKGNGTALQAAAASDISGLYGGASGTGTLCLTTNCILTTPNLGTPSALTLTNATGLPNAGVIGLGTAATVNTGTSGATIPLLNGTNTWSGVQTFTNSDLALLGSSTGATTFTSANAGASNYTLTIPAATDTLVTLAATQTLTGKSIAATQLTGALQAAQEPAHTGDCTNTAGSLALTCTATNGTNFGTFATANSATPPGIGGTTPAAGAFTTLSNTGAQTNSNASAASAPALYFTGAIETGGTGTTNFPHLLIQPSTATASTIWSTTGTAIGVNAHTGIGNLMDLQIDGVSKMTALSNGAFTITGNINAVGAQLNNGNARWGAPASNTMQQGIDSATPAAQILNISNVVAGTSNTAGVNWTFAGSQGTGTGAGGSLIFQTAPAGSTGTAKNAEVTALTIDSASNATFAGYIKTPALISTGTKFTTSGCSVSSTTGGATAGIFTLGANNCTVVITMNGATGLTAANGWTCQAHDRTTVADLIAGESSSTTTTASIVIPVTAGSTDVISFSCMGF